MRYASIILRELAVKARSSRRPKIRISSVDEVSTAAPTEMRVLALICALLLVAAVVLYQRLDKSHPIPQARKPFSAPAVPLSIVPKQLWREMKVEAQVPGVVRALNVPGLAFQWQENVPVALVEGKDLQHRVPEAIWLKLEQPGNAFVLLETNEGIFVKPLQDASPGYVSRVVTSENFGTADGEPANLEERNVRVERMWIVQDANANPKQTPGYVALMPPEERPSGLVMATVR